MKPKEYLKSIGAIEVIGRGRLSAAHKQLCHEAVLKGIKIEGFAVEIENRNVSTTSSEIAPMRVVKTATAGEKVIEDIYIPFPKHLYKAVGVADGKVYGMPEVCNNCRVSLVQCACGSPRILQTIHVRIVPLD